MRRHALNSVYRYRAAEFLSHLQKENAIKLSVSADVVETSIFRTHALLFVALLQLHIELMLMHERDTLLELK